MPSDEEKAPTEFEMRSCWLIAEADGRCVNTASVSAPNDSVSAPNLPGMWPHRPSGQLLLHAGMLQRCVLHPNSLRRYVWALLGMLYLVWDVFVIPLQICELDGDSASYLSVTVAVMLYWCLDIVVQSLTGFLTSDGCVEMRPAMTARRYLRSWFGTDVLILVSDLVVFLGLDMRLLESAYATRAGASSLKMIRLARLVRLLRLMRLQQLRDLSDNLVNSYFSQSVLLCLRVCQWFFSIMVLNHFVACAWFGIAKYSSSETTWIRSALAGEVDEGSKWHSYVLALHWSLTQFGPSTQNIGPTNTQERMFACAVVFVGLGVFSVIISGITSAVNQLRLVNMETVVEESNMRDFMTSRGLTATLYGSIASFFKNAYSKVDGRILEGDVKVFSQLPISLCMQMHEELYMPKLCKNVAVSTFYRQHYRLLNQICHTAMSERSVLAGHDIFLPTSEATSAYYSMSEDLLYDHSHGRKALELKGLQRIASSSRRATFSHSLQHVPLGSWLAEMALWCKWRHAGHLQANTTTHLICLDCTELQKIVKQSERNSIFGVRIFAILLVDHIERVQAMGEVVTDLPLSLEVTQAIASRAKGLMRIRQNLASILFAATATP
uniref:Ion transport domain-containing protein n=1 Tax=Zooxanthella nutricula TaxID=1333877 RepID=A0A7S2P1X4_9DINO